MTVGGTGESVPEALASPASASTVTGDLRAYLPGAGAHHVVALRAAAGASSGDRAAQRRFLLGGASPAGGVVDFDNDAISLLRGFETNAFAGSRVAILNAEYRWPFARPERGFKTWPVFRRTASCRDLWRRVATRGRTNSRLADVKTSLGAELSVRCRAGLLAAADRDDRRRVGTRRTAAERPATAFLRVGRAF